MPSEQMDETLQESHQPLWMHHFPFSPLPSVSWLSLAGYVDWCVGFSSRNSNSRESQKRLTMSYSKSHSINLKKQALKSQMVQFWFVWSTHYFNESYIIHPSAACRVIFHPLWCPPGLWFTSMRKLVFFVTKQSDATLSCWNTLLIGHKTELEGCESVRTLRGRDRVDRVHRVKETGSLNWDRSIEGKGVDWDRTKKRIWAAS